MPDIAMCKGFGCPMRDHCYRFRAKPSEHRQAYYAQAPRQGDQCTDFIPITDTPQDRLRSKDQCAAEEVNVPLSALVSGLRAAARRIDRMTNAPSQHFSINVTTLWAWEALLNDAANALDDRK